MTSLLFAFACLAGADPATPVDQPHVVIVVGAAGEAEYGESFTRWADQWEEAAHRGGARVSRIGGRKTNGTDGEEPTSNRQQFEAALAESRSGQGALWIVLIGHGTFDGREAKFNLDGPDVSDAELAAWVGPIERPVIVLNCASGSGPFLKHLSGDNRVVVTATRSGDELNFARFGEYLAEAIASSDADLDKDDQVSVLEAFLTASARTAEFYKSRSRLATEHALLDDNGDAFGTPADWFRGIRAVKRAKEGASPDGVRARQFHLVPSDRERRIPPEIRQRRDELEVAIAELRERKSALDENEYYDRLEELLIELGRLYRQVDAGEATDRPEGAPR